MPKHRQGEFTYFVLPGYNDDLFTTHRLLGQKAKGGGGVPKPAPKPEPKPLSIVEQWSNKQVVQWLQDTLEKEYGSKKSSTVVKHLAEVFEYHWIQGKNLLKFTLLTWQHLVKRVGIRIVLMRAAQALPLLVEDNPSPPSTDVPFYVPPDDEDEKGDEKQENVEDTCSEESFQPKAIAHGFLQTLENLFALAANSEKPHAPDYDLTAAMLEQGLRVPPQPIRFKMLFKKSRFSNQNLVTLPWKPDPSWSWFFTSYQMSLFQALRCLNHLAIMLKMWRLSDLLVVFIPCVLVWVCIQTRMTGEYNPNQFMSTVTFPMAFAINQAYVRRENALQQLAYMKACAFNYHCLMRCWSSTLNGLADDFADENHAIIVHLFRCLRLYLTSYNENEKEHLMSQMYHGFSCMNYAQDSCRLSGIAPPLGTRPTHDVREMLASTERLRIWADYRTPASIRCFVRVAPLMLSVSPTPRDLGSSRGEGGFVGPWPLFQ